MQLGTLLLSSKRAPCSLACREFGKNPKYTAPITKSCYRHQSSLYGFFSFTTANTHFRTISYNSSFTTIYKHGDECANYFLNLFPAHSNRRKRSLTSKRYFSTSKSLTTNKERLRNRKIILSKEEWERVFTEIDNDDEWMNGKIEEKKIYSNDNTKENENAIRLTNQIKDHNSPDDNFSSKHENVSYMAHETLCIESLLKDAHLLIKKIKNKSENTEWKNEDYTKVISLLKNIVQSMKENENYKEDISIPLLDLNSDNNANEIMERPKYPWMNPNLKSLLSINEKRYQQQLDEAVLTCVELIHLCMSSLPPSSPLSSSISVPYNFGMEMMNIIPSLVKEWPQIQKKLSNKKQKNNYSFSNQFLSANSLQYLGNIYLSLLKSMSASDIEKIANIDPDTITIEKNKQIILNKSEALSFEKLEASYRKESPLPQKYQNDIESLYQALISAWADSASIDMSMASSKNNHKHQDHSSFYHSAEHATYYIHCLVNDWNVIPSVQIYRRVLYIWSYLLRKKSKQISLMSHSSSHQKSRRKNTMSSSISFANNKNSEETNIQPFESSYHSRDVGNDKLYETQTENDLFQDFSAAKCAHDLFYQIKDDLEKRENSDESANDLDALKQTHSVHNIDIGTYNSILSNWANVTSVAVKGRPFSRKKISNEDYISLLNQAAEMAQNFFDQMKNESENLKGIISPNHTSYKAVIMAWMNNSNGIKADAVLKQLEENDKIEPNISCYGMVMNAYKQNLYKEKELPERLENLLTRAELNAKKILLERNLSFHSFKNKRDKTNWVTDVIPNEIFYSSVIHAWAHYKAKTEEDMMYAAERAEAILNRMKEMHEDNLNVDPPNVFCYGGVIAAWSKNRVQGLDPCLSILNDMIESYLLGNTPKNDFERKAVTIAFTTVIGRLGKNEEESDGMQAMDAIMVHLNNLQDLGWIKPDSIIMASIVDAMKRTGNGDITITKEIEELLRGMQMKYMSSGNNKLKPNIKTLNSSLDAWEQCSIKHPESRTIACKRVFALLEWAELLYENDENKNMRPGVRQYNILVRMLAKDNINEISHVKIDELMNYMEELQRQECELPSSYINSKKERIGRNVIRPDAYTYYLAIEALKSNNFISHIEKAKKAKEYLERMIKQFKGELLDKNTRRKKMSMSTMINSIELAIELCLLDNEELEKNQEVLDNFNDLVEFFYSEAGPAMPLKVLNTKIYESIINANMKLFSRTDLKNDAIDKVFQHCHANKKLTASFVEKLINTQRDDNDDHSVLFNTLASKYL